MNAAGSFVTQPIVDDRDDEIDLMALLRTLWRGKLWILLAGFIALVIGTYYAYAVAVPKYTATSVVMLENRQEQVVNLDSVMSGLSGDTESVNTELEVIRARGLIEKLVQKLDLNADPEFNAALRPEPKFSVGKIIEFISGTSNGPQKSERAILDATIDNVLKAISASNVRQSLVFRITVVTEDPKKSARIANELAQLYIFEQLEVKFQATEQATSWLTDRVAELQISLEESEIAAKDFDANSDVVGAEDFALLSRQMKDLRERKAVSERLALALDEKISDFKALEATQNREAIAQEAQDVSLNRRLDLIATGDRAAEASFDARFSQIIARLEQDQKRAQTQAQAMSETISDLERRVAGQSNDLFELQQLRREAEANRLLYEYFLSRLKETSVQKGIQQADSRLLSAAVVPTRPSAPRKSIIMVLSLMLGLMAGAGGVLAREMTQSGIRTAQDLEKLSGRTVMGQIPLIPARRRKNVLQYLTDKPNSAAAESIRNLRTSIMLSDVDNPPKVIMSTSSLPGEGKTTQSLALTQNFAGLGKKVLLIEGDIRRRIFSRYFDIEEERGLLSVLSGDAELSEIATYNEDLRADVLIGDKSTINAADVFSSNKFAKFLQKAREVYDVIIIDTPPVLVVPDARVIGQSVDAIIYTVKWDSTTETQVRQGIQMFDTVNLKVTGLVLGQIDPEGMKRYGFGGEYGAYGNYGSKYYHN